MTKSEFLSNLKSAGAFFAVGSDEYSITIAGNGLQSIYCAMLPEFLIDLYKITGGISLGDAYIFGPSQFSVGGNYPIDSILEINSDISPIKKMRGLTIFGRNDLFLFAFDAFGVCFMMDNIRLNILRKYEDPYRAMTDCVMFGKI